MLLRCRCRCVFVWSSKQTHHFASCLRHNTTNLRLQARSFGWSLPERLTSGGEVSNARNAANQEIRGSKWTHKLRQYRGTERRLTRVVAVVVVVVVVDVVRPGAVWSKPDFCRGHRETRASQDSEVRRLWSRKRHRPNVLRSWTGRVYPRTGRRSHCDVISTIT